jgi:hypothetical protein
MMIFWGGRERIWSAAEGKSSRMPTATEVKARFRRRSHERQRIPRPQWQRLLNRHTIRIFALFRATVCSFRIATALGDASEASKWP